MIVPFLARTALITSAIPTALTCINLVVYRQPPRGRSASRPVSVLIPARNEEHGIGACVESVLASHGCEIEVVVLDDASTDRTAEIVAEIAARDNRVRLEHAPSLPGGWNGKQHACWMLAHLARHDVLCFLDADVRVVPEAVSRMVAFLDQSRAQLVSGFPRQETETPVERLLIPLIQYVLLGFLPMLGTRYTRLPGFAAGCGQFMMVRREAYFAAGGHSAIRTTMHDGILLPRLLRRHKFGTDIADLSHLAVCRMYRSAAEVWRGLSKNATEGMASVGSILPFTIFLFGSSVLPFVLPPFADAHTRGLLWIAIALAYFPRVVAVLRFKDSLMSTLLHPFGIATLLALQWNALIRKLAGKSATWKERSYTVG
jgi:glycosyltransferase involved in cell wall biosynthesis